MRVDGYGYDDFRTALTQRMGYGLAYVEGIYTDEVIYKMRVDGERSGSAVTWEVAWGQMSCSTCGGASHLSRPEQDSLVDALNSVYYLSSLSELIGQSYCIRPGVRVVDVERVHLAMAEMGRVNADRCLLERAKASLRAEAAA